MRKTSRRQIPQVSKTGEVSDSFYASVFSPEEWAEIGRLLNAPSCPATSAGRSTSSLEMEVAVLRVLIRRVLERVGADDPLKALPVVRQGVEIICRALRTERMLTGESADSLAAAFATALREIGEELGLET
ncbi:MAG: hypothetical protein FJ026_17815 [Chloroflexi bacterium]|nr:hypothetical protein [Chloroflexota bacterium]